MSSKASDASNRAIRLTAPGPSAIAVIRLVGPLVKPFLEKHFSTPVPPGRAIHGILRDDHETIDDPVVVFTSNESADLNVHGSPWIVNAVLAAAATLGFAINQVVNAAHLPDAADLWPQVLASLPMAKTPLAVKALLAQPPAWAAARRPIEDIQNDRSLQTLLSLPTIALVGPANVGKSTLANTLFGQQRSIVADLPGTTRDWVGGIADIGGLAVTLIDTPGMRDTADPIERAAQAASRGPVAKADLVVLVLDHSIPLTEDDRKLIARDTTALRVANKSDRPPAWDAIVENAIETVSTTDSGVEALRHAILKRFGCDNFELDLPRVWTQSQRDGLK